MGWQQEVTPEWNEGDHAAAFASWKAAFGKEYASLEAEASAFLVWLDNWRMINDFNVAGEEPFTMRMNQFGDLTGDAFKLYVHGHTGSCMKQRTVQQRVAMQEETPDVNAPSSVDWTNVDGKSYVTPVKNQGQCGSCWAFSTWGSIEARTAIKNGQTDSAITSLSEQQLVDCSGSYGNEGCNGGLMDNAFKYVEANGGLCSEAEYAYTGRDGQCKSTECGTFYDAITSYSDVKADSATSLEAVRRPPRPRRARRGLWHRGRRSVLESEEFVGRIVGHGRLHPHLQGLRQERQQGRVRHPHGALVPRRKVEEESQGLDNANISKIQEISGSRRSSFVL